MAEKPKSLLDGGPANALGEGAARFDQMIESMRAQQAAPADVRPATAPNPLLHVGPREAWSRQFQSQGIGPEEKGLSLADLAPVPNAMLVPPVSGQAIVPDRAAEIAPRPTIAPMGAQIGRSDKFEPRRRSWLGRMFRGI